MSAGPVCGTYRHQSLTAGCPRRWASMCRLHLQACPGNSLRFMRTHGFLNPDPRPQTSSSLGIPRIQSPQPSPTTIMILQLGSKEGQAPPAGQLGPQLQLHEPSRQLPAGPAAWSAWPLCWSGAAVAAAPAVAASSAGVQLVEGHGTAGDARLLGLTGYQVCCVDAGVMCTASLQGPMLAEQCQDPGQARMLCSMVRLKASTLQCMTAGIDHDADLCTRGPFWSC